MNMRSRILIATGELVMSWQLTQAQAARRLGITQPRLNDLLRGKIAKFNLETLIDLASRAGLRAHGHRSCSVTNRYEYRDGYVHPQY